MVYFECLQVNPHIQAVQNMSGKGGWRVFQAELQAGEVYPIFQKNIASKTNQHGVIVYEPTLIQFGADILKIVALLVFFNGS